MPMSAKTALREAARDAWRTIAAGLLLFAMWLCLVSFGPGLEGRFFPVIENYQLANVRKVQNGGYSFTPHFSKTRDCTYYGVTWFGQQSNGNLIRVQLGRQQDQGPPVTGPTGDRVGERVVLYPPEGVNALFGLNHHDCGFVWQTRTMVGPFRIVDGKLQSTPSTAREALRG